MQNGTEAVWQFFLWTNCRAYFFSLRFEIHAWWECEAEGQMVTVTFLSDEWRNGVWNGALVRLWN